jgi:bacillithiol biosynthesis cysteine-adding enzyme BshC
LTLIEQASPLPRLVPTPGADRKVLAAALAATNAAYGHPRAEFLAERLAAPGTAVVVTGQQTGLFGGPLLALVKAAAAVRWAEALEAAGTPAVAVFWMATEDHDFDEVARAAWPVGESLCRVDLGSDLTPLAPVGTRTFGDGLEAALARLREASPDPGFAAQHDRIAGWFRPRARFGEAFARLLVAILGERSPLFLDAMLPELKAAQRPVLRQFVERRHELLAVTTAKEAQLLAAGRELQVRPQGSTSPLFLLRDGARRRIEWVGADQFRLRGEDAPARPVDELLAAIEDNPSVVSPGVLARPVVQDAVLATTLQVLGGAELTYLEQVAPTYELLGITAPAVVRRPSALLLEPRFERWMSGLGLTSADLLAEDSVLAAHLARRHGTRAELATARAQVAEILAGLAPGILALEPQLERPWHKTHEHVLGGLDRLAEKVDAAIVRHDEVAARQLATLRAHLAPGGVLPERVVATAWAWARYGQNLGPALLDGLSLEPGSLCEVRP